MLVNFDSNIKICAFDFFDTLAIRDCNPETIIMRWARSITAELCLDVSPEELYKHRKECEKKLKSSSKKEDFFYHELIEGLYSDLQQTYGSLNVTCEAFFKKCLSIEEAIEGASISLNKQIIKKASYNYENNIQNIIISDFYLPKVFFEHILEKNGVKHIFKDIYVSSEIGLRKDSSNLYRFVLRSEHIQGTEMCMIGDNAVSDYKIPLSLGIVSFLVEKKADELKCCNNEKQIKKSLKRIFRNNNKEFPFNGYNSALILFCDRLYKEVIGTDCKVLLFCSREGQKLQRLFNIYQNILYPHNCVQTQYFYVSRRSTLLPSLRNINTESFSSVFRQYKEMKICDFLYTIGFSYEEINELQKKIQFNAEDCVDEKMSTDISRILLNSALFGEMYEKKRMEQKQTIRKYINELDAICNNTLYIVDIGWKGSIQDNLYSCFDEKLNIRGYYFGLNYMTKRTVNNCKKGFMFENDKKKNSIKEDLFEYNCVELERIFAADHGQTLSYSITNGSVYPVLSKDKDDLALHNYISKWQDNMIYSFCECIKLIDSSFVSVATIEDFLIKEYLHYMCINAPYNRKIYLEFRRKDRENFGNISGKSKGRIDSNIREKEIKKKFGYVDYSYRLLDKYRLSFLSPLAHLYCCMVYQYKKHSIRLMR